MLWRACRKASARSAEQVVAPTGLGLSSRTQPPTNRTSLQPRLRCLCSSGAGSCAARNTGEPQSTKPFTRGGRSYPHGTARVLLLLARYVVALSAQSGWVASHMAWVGSEPAPYHGQGTGRAVRPSQAKACARTRDSGCTATCTPNHRPPNHCRAALRGDASHACAVVAVRASGPGFGTVPLTLWCQSFTCGTVG